MNVRSYTKRLFAMLLCVMLVVGMLPTTVFAAESDTDYLFLATDRHANTSIIGNIINNMEKTIGENKLDYLGLGGDMVGSGNSHPAYNSSTVLAEVTGATSSLSASNVDIVAGIHDMNVTDDAGIVLPYQKGCAEIYEGDKFYVYGVEEYCISDDSNESNWSAQAQKFVDWANGSDIDKSKVIVVLSHYPLHVRRNDNDGAYYWHKALNDVATADDGSIERNVLFFHGHNHTVDKNEYVYNVGDTMSIQNGSSTTSETISYTYATAGYLNQNSKATLMAITDDTITLTKYGTNSSSAMTSVTRVVQEPVVTLESIAVSGETEYTVGDELALTVTATYSDNTTKDVTADAEITGADMSVAGDYTVTATYENLTATCEITVAAAQEPSTDPTEAEKSVSCMTINEGSGVPYVVGDEAILYKIYVAYTDGTESYATQDDCTMVIYDANNNVVTEADALATPGEYSAEITYLGFTCGTKLTFTVHESGDSAYDLLNLIINGAEVTADVKNVTDDAAVVAAMATLTDIDGYVAYDITADLAEGATATVSIPVSTDWAEGEFAVYYITNEGVISDETFEPTYADGYVTFTATHFSTYTVTVTLPSGDNVSTGGDTAVVPDSDAVYTAEEVTVYKRVSAPVANGSYLIVSATNYGLGSNQSGYDVSALDTDAASYYTSWNGSTNTGTLISAGDVYITTSDAFPWEVGGSTGAYTFSSGSFTLGATATTSSGCDGSTTNPSLTFTGTTNNSTTWSYTNNILTTTYDDNTINLILSGSSWDASSSGSATVYFYEPVKLTKVTVSGGGDGGVYKATGTDQFNVTTSNGKTITLASTLTWTPNSTGVESTVTDLTNWTVKYTEVSDASNIISITDNGPSATLSGIVGTATLSVTYQHATYGTAYDDFVITTKQAGGTTVTGTSGMHVDKTVELQADGTYTINLEAFSTGATVTTETEAAKPVDIVLVLDTSSSMDEKDVPLTYNANGSVATYTYRYTALYNAVVEFAKTVYAKSADQNVNHRISIVAFNGDSDTRIGLTDTNTTEGQTAINNAITPFATFDYSQGGGGGSSSSDTLYGQGTKPATGLETADSILDAAEAVSGYDRNQVVIVFTDGYPGAKESVKADAANPAGDAALTLKNENVKVFTIAMLCDDDVGPDKTADTSTSEKTKVNYFLHAVSSNYPKASAGGNTSSLSSITLGTKNTDGVAYYQSAQSNADLSSIFTSIASSTTSSGTTVSLDEYSVMKDIIGAEFTVPAGTDFSNVTLTVVDGSTTDGVNFSFGSTASTTFPDTTLLDYDVVANEDGSHDINITGFDYSKYYITSNKQTTDGQYKLIVTISGIKVANNAATDTVFNTNGEGSGIYAKDADASTVAFPQPKSVVTSKLYVLDYAKDVTLDEADWYAKTVNLADAYTTTSNYGTWNADGSALTYSPKTTMWGGFDTATVIGEVNTAFATEYPAAVADGASAVSTAAEGDATTAVAGNGANKQYVLSKVSVIPANNVYYEDSFVTSEATGNVGIEFSDGWTVTGSAANNTEVPEDKEDSGLGKVHGWIDSMDNDTTFSDGTAHVSSTVGSTATFSFTGTGVDVYSYTDMQSGMVIGMLYEGEGVMDGDSYKVAQKTLIVDNLAVSGDYYQIPTLSFENLTYGTYTLRLYVSSAKAPELNAEGTVKVDENGEIVYKTDETRSTYYLDGIRVYNPLGATTNAYTGTNQKTEFVEIRNIILEESNLINEFNTTEINNALFIDLDSEGTTASAIPYNKTEFNTYGPKNEVYLGVGQTIAFKVENTAAEYYVGLKSPTGAALKVYTFGASTASVPFSHTTDQYYKLTPNADGMICIYNDASSGGILSVTKIQMVGPEATTFALRRMTPVEATDFALASVASIEDAEEIIPEETVPEETVPEETVPEETVPDIKVEIENKVNEAKNTLRGFVNKLFGSMSSWFGR